MSSTRPFRHRTTGRNATAPAWPNPLPSAVVSPAEGGRSTRMRARRPERRLNLVSCLLASRRYLSKEQIRASVEQYASCQTDDAFERMFERDKDELREMGIPLET